jgi:hypothetical protein
MLLIAACTALGGCISANSPRIINRLKTVSAGHTGCVPESIDITNVKAAHDGSGTWNATCGGKTYLCSAVATVGHSESYSCAPAVQ